MKGSFWSWEWESPRPPLPPSNSFGWSTVCWGWGGAREQRLKNRKGIFISKPLNPRQLSWECLGRRSLVSGTLWWEPWQLWSPFPHTLCRGRFKARLRLLLTVRRGKTFWAIPIISLIFPWKKEVFNVLIISLEHSGSYEFELFSSHLKKNTNW